ARNMVLPDGSAGSSARPPMRLERDVPGMPSAGTPASTMGAGPTAGQAECDRGLAVVRGKMGTLAVAWSATASPRPLVGAARRTVMDGLFSVAGPPAGSLVIRRTQRPPAGRPRSRPNGSCGLNVAENGAAPRWIGAGEASSNTVLVKLARLVPLPPSLARGRTRAPARPTSA